MTYVIQRLYGLIDRKHMLCLIMFGQEVNTTILGMVAFFLEVISVVMRVMAVRKVFMHSGLYGIHEVALGTAEDDDAEEEGDEREEGAVEEAAPREGAAGEAGVFEGLEDGGQGVEGDDITILLWCSAQGVDDRGGIHEELDAKLDEKLEIAVLGGEGGDDQACSHC